MAEVSVIIPVYNAKQYLKECVDSVRKQTLTDIEIICVDDGSTDGSSTMLDHYAKEDERIKVIHKKNTGYGHSMNCGLRMAAGRYIAIVESDDYIKQGMLKDLLELADRFDLDIAKADYEEFVGTSESIQFQYKSVAEESLYGKVLNPTVDTGVFEGYISHWAGIYRKSFLEENQICFNETKGASYQDLGFWFLAYAFARRVYLSNNAYYQYRQDNPNSSIADKAKVFCVCDEYEYIDSKLQRQQIKYHKLQDVLQKCKLYIYLYNLNRIAEEYKIDFLERFQQEYIEALKSGKLHTEFFTEYERFMLSWIMEDAKGHYLQSKEYPKRLLNQISEFETVIIYGAGMVGKKVLDIALKNGCKQNIIFAVSQMDKNPSQIQGIPVQQIDSLIKYKDTAVVLVAVTEKYQEEIKEKINKLGYRNLLKIQLPMLLAR